MQHEHDMTNRRPAIPLSREREVRIPMDGIALEGTLHLPSEARGIVLFAHGSGSSRHSPRNQAVAATLHAAGLGTLLFDLLTADEEAIDARTAHLRFDIAMLAGRLALATDWVVGQEGARDLPVGYFGASTGGGAALVAAAERPAVVRAVVSRGGRPDLAGDDALGRVRAPTLLIVGGHDAPVIEMNRTAMKRLTAEKELAIVQGATHLFAEPGTLEEVARLASNWFRRYLAGEPVAENPTPAPIH
jgi:putative phosphoribosyl transferase